MTNALAIFGTFILGLFVGIIVILLMNPPVEIEDHDHVAEMPHTHDMHAHEQMELPTQNAPTVALSVTPDAKAGWNLQIQTTNFEFAPERASSEHIAGEGHAHLYIDGEKITRVYGNWYYLPELTPGEHEIEVTLNSNSHEDLVVDGVAISASKTIVVE